MKKKELVVSRNAKVSRSRGEVWRRKLITGRHDAAANPSKVRLARLTKGLAQDSISDRIGTSLATYGSIERGFRPVEKPRAEMIAKILKQPLKKLFKSEPGGKLIAIKSSNI